MQFLSLSSTTLNGDKRTNKIYCTLIKRAIGESQSHTWKWGHHLAGLLVPSPSATVALVLPISNFLTCRDDPISFTQLTENEIYPSCMVRFLVVMFYDQSCNPMSWWQDNWISHVKQCALIMEFNLTS
jgi:hypothetical protein